MPPPLLLAAALLYVVDGDTLDLGGVRYRIADIDAPEIHGRCPAERELASRARDRLRDLVSRGADIVPTGRSCGWGRLCALVYTDGVSVSAVLVREGLARHYRGERRAGWC
jgi:micrococcal nuclease